MCGCKHHVKIASKHAQHQHSSASPRHTRCMCSISHWHLSAQIFIVLCCQNQHETIGATPVAFYAVVSCDIRMCYDALSALFEAPRSQLRIRISSSETISSGCSTTVMDTQEDDDDFGRATKLSEITDTSQVDPIPLGMQLGCILYLNTKLNMRTLGMFNTSMWNMVWRHTE